jgi:hypothetical protein
MSTSSLLGLVTPAVCLLLHALLNRVFGNHGIARQKFTLLIVGLTLLLITACAMLLHLPAMEILNTFILSGLFSYIYFQWFNMSETARRIRILVRFVALNEAPPKADLTADAQRIFFNRQERMLALGTIKKMDHDFVLVPGPLLYATRAIMFWRRLFFPDPKR